MQPFFRWLTVAILLNSQAIFLFGCTLPTRPVSPNNRYGQVSATVHTNAGQNDNATWPLLAIRSVLTGEEHLLRQQTAATLNSVHYSGRVPPGRYRLLGLLSDPTPAARKAVLTKSLGNFDVTTNEHCRLGNLLHWQQAQTVNTRSLRRPMRELCWNQDGQDKQRARHFAERRQALKPPAKLGSGAVLRHSGLLSYRSSANHSWQVIDSGAVNITAAAELNPEELLIGGEQGLLIYSNNNKQQRLPLQPADSVVLALTTAGSETLMLISTAETLQLLHSPNIHDTPWQIIGSSDDGYKKTATENILWSVAKDRFVAKSKTGKTLLTLSLP